MSVSKADPYINYAYVGPVFTAHSSHVSAYAYVACEN